MTATRKKSHLTVVSTTIHDDESLASGGGGPHDPDMKTRIALLEHKVDTLDRRMTDLDTTVRTESRTIRSELRTEFNDVLGKFEGRVNNEFRRVELQIESVRTQGSMHFWRLCLLIVGSLALSVAGKSMGWL